MDDDTLTLGGKIQLSGFSDLEPASMIVLKKIIGTHARRLSDKHAKFELLKLSMKKVHEQEHSEKYEVRAIVVIEGKQFNAEVTERNLFFALDSAIKKVENELGK